MAISVKKVVTVMPPLSVSHLFLLPLNAWHGNSML